MSMGKKKFHISIAMTTYNGERFLKEQLDSFLWQTRLPDELVVCDDGSTDRTLEILENFARTAPFPVKIFRNPQRLGFSKNFEKAINLCQGELIFLSDQDDIWMPNKIVEIEKVFIKYPFAGVVFSDAFLVNENLIPTNKSLFDHYGINIEKIINISPGKFIKKYNITNAIIGAVIAIKSEIREIIFPIPSNWSHDGWITFAGGLVAHVFLLPIKLIKYRRHANQLYGISAKLIEQYNKSKKVERDYYIRESLKWENTLNHKVFKNIILDEFIKEIITQISIHLKTRGSLPENKFQRLPIILREVKYRRYQKYSNGWKSIIKDVFF